MPGTSRRAAIRATRRSRPTSRVRSPSHVARSTCRGTTSHLGSTSLPQPEHRQEVAVAASGVHVIDNTFSSNPASAESSLSLLAFTGAVDARRVVVTPGNGRARPAASTTRTSASAAARRSSRTTSSSSGQTNRAAPCSQGRPAASPSVHRSRTARMRSRGCAPRSRPGDVVLYENDLPDHHP